MPAGRPSKYDPVVYGLTDKDGVVFYVGKTINADRRMADYRSGRFHGNRLLKDMVAKHGVNHVILRSACDDLSAAEFEEIESRSGLVNLITSRSQSLRYANSAKPWIIPGILSPSTVYMRHMRNAFGDSCGWLKSAMMRKTDAERVEAERRLAEAFSRSRIGTACLKWMEAMDARA